MISDGNATTIEDEHNRKSENIKLYCEHVLIVFQSNQNLLNYWKIIVFH